ncbi:peptidase C13 family-domain-containing protein [Lasiosphaeria miniovina]|uniref:Peptidase C13 family-domain-containing protein n=1 Tax=Lasiosphaeria miniovina TaxID=1954250 RepID=A0AA40AU59_9PEZI|nr:peptidase C13 family-domain-containing protein [Lasiosphaeria miniovina]KAK0721979.1 peptidase C13 family-domain-containing protein [Lasiosphaeria miniovina]
MKLANILRLPALLAATLLAPVALVGAEHTSNWAVLVCTSRFWFNYRHLANVLSIYRTVKRLGIPDSQIILMLPDDMACNPRNAFPGTVYSNADRAVDLYGDNIEVDYRGYEVTVENFIRLLTDRVGDEMPRSKRLLTDDRSNILVYMTGHGGNEFLKFQDAEEIGAFDLADAFEQMWEKKRYHEILFMIDTCQANTMYSKLYSPNIIATGSSELDQSSYSHHADNDVGVAVIDRYTYYNLEMLEMEVRDTSSKKTVGDLFDSYTYEKIHSHAGVRYDLFPGGEQAARSRLVTDFFGNVQNVEIDGSKNAALEEDMLSLSRAIAALRQRAEEEDAAQKNTTSTAKSIGVDEVPGIRETAFGQEGFGQKCKFGIWVKMSANVPKQKYLPLREITLSSRPLVKRGIAFSCDGELAVAADDSVHVFVPEFPDLTKRREGITKLMDGRPSGSRTDGAEVHDTDGNSPEEDEDLNFNDNRNNKRHQYSEGSKHMPVSFPPLDPRVNRELFTTARIPFPYDPTGGQDDSLEDDEDEDVDYDAEEKYSDQNDSDSGDGYGATPADKRPFGAGYGPLTGVGSTMNHVVRMSWSPSGLGINRRPILAVMTAAGSVAMYGDNSAAANIPPRANGNMLKRRELSSWVVLWGVGERLIVPGQQAKTAENIQGFAWSYAYGPGQVLLATINDLKEVAIISVQTVFVAETTLDENNAPRVAERRENLVWQVQEVARFEAKGPHPPRNIMDPDWVPCGTSFGLSWSPMAQRTCVISFIDRNYVGFRNIVFKTPWIRGELPKLDISSRDVYGKCIHMSTDAFVEFEDTVSLLHQMFYPFCSVPSRFSINMAKVWPLGTSALCRGLIVTGFHVKPFEVSLTGTPHSQQAPHSPKECGTTYLDETADKPSHNPIIDLFIHPPDPSKPTSVPLYTLARLSATTTNQDWYETNAPHDEDSETGDPTIPQWARDISDKLQISIPADMRFKRRYGGDSESDVGSASDNSDADMEGFDVDESDEDDDEDDDADTTATSTVPEIHPHRFRLHGLAASPGAGVSVVLVSTHSTQNPERGGWHTVRSAVMFGYKPPPQPTLADQGSEEAPSPGSADPTPRPQTLTTEARLFEWLYGGGPEVPGVTVSNRQVTSAEDSCRWQAGEVARQAELLRIRNMFQPAIERQTCDLCGSKMAQSSSANAAGRGPRPLSGCENGHFFDICATSGLAIQMPGTTRSCGACGQRTMRAEILAEKIPERWKDIMAEVGDGVCGGCGGKFLN